MRRGRNPRKFTAATQLGRHRGNRYQDAHWCQFTNLGCQRAIPKREGLPEPYLKDVEAVKLAPKWDTRVKDHTDGGPAKPTGVSDCRKIFQSRTKGAADRGFRCISVLYLVVWFSG